jgi:hypothetical protein
MIEVKLNKSRDKSRSFLFPDMESLTDIQTAERIDSTYKIKQESAEPLIDKNNVINEPGFFSAGTEESSVFILLCQIIGGGIVSLP